MTPRFIWPRPGRFGSSLSPHFTLHLLCVAWRAPYPGIWSISISDGQTDSPFRSFGPSSAVSAFPAQPPTTMAAADFSLRLARSPFQARGEISPGKNAILPCTTAGFTPPDLWPQELRGSLPARPDRHRLLSGSCPSARSFDPRFLPTVGRPSAVALHFVRCGQLTRGLSPPKLRPCWAHNAKKARCDAPGLLYDPEATGRKANANYSALGASSTLLTSGRSISST